MTDFALYTQENADLCSNARFVGGTDRWVCECSLPRVCPGVKAANSTAITASTEDQSRKTPNVILLCDSNQGVYIPQIMISRLLEAGWQGISEYNAAVLKEGTDNDDYWSCWDEVLTNATFEDEEKIFILHQDGDLFAVAPDFMSESEYLEFYGEER